ncbi:MAG: YggS family pyridoxal phosphate-dependent enzyme, partial [Gammaproteobacteria bacterium]|nr:YggS family pyridoxal phosphate-dependent enzyme [Gammaproteobacteria bacterium]
MSPQQAEIRYHQVVTQIAAAELQHNRPSGSVQLLAVSKTRNSAEIREMVALGQRRYGENYLQEALLKIDELADLPIEWHFIGPIQSNKTRPIAESFSWVHSVDRLKIAQRLNDQRPSHLPPLNICIQVNVSGEQSKSGCSLEALDEFAAATIQLPNISLRGLMTIPQSASSFDE